MVRRSLALLVAATLGMTACTDDDSADPPVSTTLTPTSTTAAPPAATIVIQEAMPEPVRLPGEQTEMGENPGNSLGQGRQIEVQFPDDIEGRNDLILGGYSDSGGWDSFAAVGTRIVFLPEGDPVEVYLIFESALDPAWQPLRRLARIDRADLGWVYELRPDYETLADVLTMQPGDDGNYLELIR